MDIRKPAACPQCGSTRVLRILYGKPAPEAMQAAGRGEIVLGGCCITPGQPDWVCAECDHRWFDPSDPVCIAREQRMREILNGNDRDRPDY